MKAVIILFVITFLFSQTVYCEDIELYLYKTDDGTKTLISQLYSGSEWIRLAITADGNILKPAQATNIWNDWKFTYFVKLAGIITKTSVDDLDIDNQHLILSSFASYIEDQLKSNYVSIVQVPELSSDLVLYDINGIFESPINDSNIAHLGKFGYGINNATGKDILASVKKGNSAIILDPPFRESFGMSMQNYATKIPKPKNMTYYYITPLFFVIVALFVFSFYTFKKMQSIQEEKQRLTRNISNIEKQMKTAGDEPVKSGKDEIAQRDKYCLESALSVLGNIYDLIAQRSKMMKFNLPVNEIQNLLESIGKKTEGKWLEPAKKRLNEIVYERLGVNDSNTGMPVPENIEEFSKIKWSEHFASMVDSLASSIQSAKMPDNVSKQLTEAIGRDVIAMVIDAVDREKNSRGVLDQSVENDLRQLLFLTGIRELEVRTGQVYNPETNELVVSSDPSLVTDREQRISRIISRGLVLPSGKIIKAKVSIQKRA